MNILPYENNIPIDRLTAVFNETTNSYKFYWLLAILDEIKENGSEIILMQDLYRRILEDVWYPINYYQLSFGKSDRFKQISDFINSQITVDYGVSSKKLFQQIDNEMNINAKTECFQKINELARWVPYRFIRPFFANETRGIKDSLVNNELIQLAYDSSVRQPEYCPYYFRGNEIVLNKIWFQYLLKNIGLIKGFTYWYLIKFLQKNNPNVPGIAEKIFKPTQRNLRKNIEGWRKFIELCPEQKCIYSGLKLSSDLSLDHFIPWSFTTNDLNWNLVTVSKRVNSMKGNRLPNLNLYLEPFADLQYTFFKTMLPQNNLKIVLEDYCLLFNQNLSEINQLSKDLFKQRIIQTIFPTEQIASNMGFIRNWEYQFQVNK